MVKQNLKIIFNPFDEHGLDCETRLAIYDEKKGIFSHLIELKPKESFEIKLSELGSHKEFKYKYQIKNEARWVDEIRYKYINPEEYTEDGIKYLFFPQKNSEKLVVVFQAINRNPAYNYVGTLNDKNVSRLYIKDDYGSDKATRTSYYLGPNKSDSIASSVIKLIENIRNNLDIRKKDVICAGSSKGGFAALYFAYRGGYGNVVAGGPQVLLGDYLYKGRLDYDKAGSILPPILEYVAGEYSEESAKWANKIMANAMQEIKDSDPHVYIHVGKGEPHYQEHVLPFLKIAEQLNKKNITIDVKDYDTHSELAKHFPIFLANKVNEIINNKDS